MRNSKARNTILAELRKLKTHPRGDELFHLVRQKLPRVSLATVYRNLDQLRQAGLVNELHCGDYNRYDADISYHHHFQCRSCSKLWDVETEINIHSNSLSDCLPGFGIDGHYVMFYGVCPDCQTSQAS